MSFFLVNGNPCSQVVHPRPSDIQAAAINEAWNPSDDGEDHCIHWYDGGKHTHSDTAGLRAILGCWLLVVAGLKETLLF